MDTSIPNEQMCPNPNCRRVVQIQGQDDYCPSCGLTFERDEINPTAAFQGSSTNDLRATLILGSPGTGPAAEENPLTHLGRFEVREWLGSGAFGDVYRAYDPQLDREVALKVAKPGSLDTPERASRFLREAKAAANLRHQNIVPLYETGKEGERIFLVSAYIKGRTLEAVIQETNEKGQQLSAVAAGRIALKLAEALTYAHTQGIVHRDVKPANIIVDESGEPLLMDFGLAARVESGDERLTQDGQGMGTPAYLAPEQADGRGIAASDQYSLGCTIYEMLTGRTPFAGGPVQQIFLHQTQAVPPLRKLAQGVPRDLDTVVMKCLEKEAAQRYHSCANLAGDIRRFLDGEPVRARRIGPLERLCRWMWRNPGIAVSLAVAITALIAGTAVSLWQADVAQRSANDALEKKNLADGETAKARAEAKENRRLLGLAQLVQAQKALEDGYPSMARSTLQAIVEENRCIGWRLLKHATEQSVLRFHETRLHHDPKTALAISQDGARVAVASSDGTIRIRETRTGTTVALLIGHTDKVLSLALTPDATRLISGSADRTARVWDVDTGREAAVLTGHKNPVDWVGITDNGLTIVTSSETTRLWHAGNWNSMAILPHQHAQQLAGDLLVTRGSLGGGIRLLDVNTGQLFAVFGSHRNETCTHLSLSLDGTFLAAYLAKPGIPQGRIILMDLGNGQRHGEFYGPVGITQMHLLGNGKNILVREAPPMDSIPDKEQQQVSIWDTDSGQKVSAISERDTEFHSSADGSRIVTSTGIWETRTGRLLRRFLDKSACVTDLTATCIATLSRDGTCRIIGPDDGVESKRLHGHTHEIAGVCGCDDGSRIVTGSTDGKICIWNMQTGQLVRECIIPKLPFHALTLSQDGATLAIAYANKVDIYQVDGYQLLAELTGDVGKAVGLAFVDDGRRVIVGSGDGTIRIWDVHPTQVDSMLLLNQKLNCLTQGRDGTMILTGERTGLTEKGEGVSVRLWKIGQRKPQITLQLGVSGNSSSIRDRVVHCVCLDETNAKALSASGEDADYSIQIWDLKTGRLQHTLKGHTARITGAVFSPDGTRVISVSHDATLRLWDSVTGQVLVVLKGPSSGFSSLHTNREGTQIITGSRTGEVIVWDASHASSELDGTVDGVSNVVVSPDGNRVITSFSAYPDHPVRVSDANTGKIVAELRECDSSPRSIACNVDGTRVVLGNLGKTIVWDTQTDHVVHLKTTTYSSQIAMSHDGSLVATAGFTPSLQARDGVRGVLLEHVEPEWRVQLWNAQHGNLIREYRSTKERTKNLAFGTDMQRFGFELVDGAHVVWDTTTGNTVDGEPMPRVTKVTNYTPDGKYLYAWCGDRVRKFPVALDDMELSHRSWRTRPNPAWHLKRQQQLITEANAYGVALHKAFETRARGLLSLEQLDLKNAQNQLFLSALLMPQAPRIYTPILTSNGGK